MITNTEIGFFVDTATFLFAATVGTALTVQYVRKLWRDVVSGGASDG